MPDGGLHAAPRGHFAAARRYLAPGIPYDPQMPTPSCNQCGYDLSGVGTDNFLALCPACGRSSDVRTPPLPAPRWWRIPVAIAIGTAVEVAIALAAVAIVSLSNIEVSRLMFPAVAQIAMICGPVASMWFVWRDRILFALVRRWVWARKAWIMFVTGICAVQHCRHVHRRRHCFDVARSDSPVAAHHCDLLQPLPVQLRPHRPRDRLMRSVRSAGAVPAGM